MHTHNLSAVTLPFTLVHGLVYVMATINASGPLSCVLDTGSSLSVVGPALAGALGLRPRETPPDGPMQALGPGQGADQSLTFYDGVTLRLGGATLRRQTVAGLPLDYIAVQAGHPTDAILGGNVFRRFVVELDHAVGGLTLIPPRAHASRPDPVPLTVRDGVPYVRAAVGTENEWMDGEFLIDSGQAGSALLLTEHFVRAHPSLAPYAAAARPAVANAVGGRLCYGLGDVPRLRVGGVTLSRPATVFPQGAGGIYAAPRLAGIIGSGVLTRYRVVFDYAGRRLWLDETVPS